MTDKSRRLISHIFLWLYLCICTILIHFVPFAEPTQVLVTQKKAAKLRRERPGEVPCSPCSLCFGAGFARIKLELKGSFGAAVFIDFSHVVTFCAASWSLSLRPT